jgi:hypothetical protein
MEVKVGIYAQRTCKKRKRMSRLPSQQPRRHLLRPHPLTPPLPPPCPKDLRRYLRVLPLPLHQLHPPLPLHIDTQLLPLKLALTRPLDQMAMHHALSQRAFHIKLEPHMLRAPPIRLLLTRQVPIPRISRPRVLAVRGNLVAGAEELLARGVLADLRDGAVEEGGFGGGREDVVVENVGDAELGMC